MSRQQPNRLFTFDRVVGEPTEPNNLIYVYGTPNQLWPWGDVDIMASFADVLAIRCPHCLGTTQPGICEYCGAPTMTAR